MQAASLALASAASAPAALAQGFDPTGQVRTVDVAITVTMLDCYPPPTGCVVFGTPVNYSDNDSAPDFSPFSATASVSPFTGYAASQSSSLSASLIRAQGSGQHAGSGGFTPPPANRATATSGSSDSHFEVSFDVDAPTPIHLTGSVAATGGLSANSTAQILLRTSGGSTIAEVVAATDPYCQDPSCFEVGPFPLDYEGVLAAGSYVLEASTEGSAWPFYFAGNFIPLASTGQYQVRLAHVAVPALGPAALALLALSLGLAAAPFLARARPRRGATP
jgi:hypothetical protein